jgi:rod shape-determining protein MreD
MATYHWTIYRPDRLPAPSLFLIGIIQDLLSGGLPGETAVTLLLVRAIVLPQRHYFVDPLFAFIWAGFTLLTAGAMLFSWALHSLVAAEFLDLRGPVLRAVLTITVFPIASFLLGRSQRALIGAD